MDLRRRAQSRAIRAVRSSRFFPKTLVNRLGEDADFGERRIEASVIVYFPGALDTLYQITPWLPTFEAVHRAHGLAIVCQDSRVSAALRALTAADVITIARYGTLDGALGRSSVKLALYVSHQPRNFESLRFASLLHAYIGHGDSDKGVSASNQLKAYDTVFAPGQASIDRITARLMRFDADKHCVIVGQPLTLSAPPAGDRPAHEKPTVLYAPTWEGGQPSVAYSSVLTHGVRMIEALIADGRFRVIYRPHPLIGVTSREYAGANQAIIGALQGAGPAAGHVVVGAEHETLETSFDRADALVCDVSAVATAWLPSLRPIVVTAPAGLAAVTADSGMLAKVPRLAPQQAQDVVTLLADELEHDPGREVRRDLVTYYLSEYWPDRVMDRFVEVCGALMAERDTLRATLPDASGT
jgi:CDP-Glycerol:Poly(glycerophosphate) glycerophosphotransferase